MSRSGRMTAQECAKQREWLLHRRETLLVDVEQLKTSTASNGPSGMSGDLSVAPTHMADVAGDNYDKEITFGLIETEHGELRLIDAALKRVEEGTYGLCESCSKPIPKARLRALPYARFCLECQQAQELGYAEE